MLDEPTIQFLQAGCSQVIGTADPDRRPHASRSWGITVVDPAAGRLRVLLDAADRRTLTCVEGGGQVAITCSDVATLQSLQLKGRALAVEPVGEIDRRRHREYLDEFLGAIHRTDGIAMELLERWGARGVVACVVEVDAAFDQTPGPAAGAQVPVGGPK